MLLFLFCINDPMLADFEKKNCSDIKLNIIYNGEDWDAFIGHLIVNFFDAFFMVCDAFLKKHKSVDNIFGSIDFCLFWKICYFLLAERDSYWSSKL